MDVANYLALIGLNDELYTQDRDDSTTYDVFTVNAQPVNKGAYTEIGIAFARGSPTTVVNNQAAVITLMRKGSVAWARRGRKARWGRKAQQGRQDRRASRASKDRRAMSGRKDRRGLMGRRVRPGRRECKAPSVCLVRKVRRAYRAYRAYKGQRDRAQSASTQATTPNSVPTTSFWFPTMRRSKAARRELMPLPEWWASMRWPAIQQAVR